MGPKIYSVRAIRQKFLLIQYTYLSITYLCIQVDGIEVSPWMLIMMSVWNIISYSYLCYKEVKFAPEIHPFTILALVCVQYIGINGISCALNVLNDDEVLFAGNKIDDILVLGIWYLSLQHVLSYTTYYWIINRKISKHTVPYTTLITESTIPYRRWALIVYKYLWILRIADLIIGISALTTLLGTFCRDGQLITLTLLVFGMLRNPYDKKLSKIFWIIVCIEIVRVLGVGSKQVIITNLIPYALYLLWGYKLGIVKIGRKLLMSLGCIVFFVVFVVFPYIAVFRDIANRKHITWSEVEVSEVLSEYGDYLLGTGRYANNKDKNKSTTYLAERAGAIGCNAWAIDYAQRKGIVPKYLLFNAVSLVPRVIWPDKPPNIVGNMLYHIALGDPYWEVKSLTEYESGATMTYISAGFIGGCYFSLGPIAAIFFSLFAGWFIAKFWLFLRGKLYYNIIAIWAFYSFFSIILTDFEVFDDCGIVFYSFSLFYVLVIKYFFPFSKYSGLIRQHS